MDLTDRGALRHHFIHPVVMEDPRIPGPMKESLNGEHPGLFLQRAREEAGLSPAEFVRRVNELLRQEHITPNFTLEELGSYESGERPISNRRMSEICETLGVGVGEILYNIKPGQTPVVDMS